LLQPKNKNFKITKNLANCRVFCYVKEVKVK